MGNNTNENKGQKEAVFEELKRNPRHYSTNNRMRIYCQEKAIDELDGWEYLSRVDIDDDYKDDIQAICKREAVTFIRASYLFNDGPIPGIGIDQARNIFQVLKLIGDETAKVHVYRSDPGTIVHLVDRGLRPEMVKGISILLERLCQYIKHSISWDLCGYLPAKEDPSSILVPIDQDSHIERWLRDINPGVKLEIHPGQYESVQCTVIFDETALLVYKTRAVALPDLQASERVMDGIAKAFEHWFETDDRTLTCIIRQHKLPEHQNRVSYRGRFKADAVRFANAVGMTLGELNACFIASDGKEFKRNALAKKGISGSPNFKDEYKDSGIYVPLREFGILE